MGSLQGASPTWGGGGGLWELDMDILFFAETVIVYLQCISCFKKVQPWVFGGNNYLIAKVVIQFSFLLYS